MTGLTYFYIRTHLSSMTVLIKGGINVTGKVSNNFTHSITEILLLNTTRFHRYETGGLI